MDCILFFNMFYIYLKIILYLLYKDIADLSMNPFYIFDITALT